MDIVIVSVPFSEGQLPPAAPALLKAAVEAAGFRARCIDFNIRMQPELTTYYSTGYPETQEVLAQAQIDAWADELAQIPTRWIGISVFTYQSRVAAVMLCRALRSRTTAQIVLGGQGLADSGIQGTMHWAEDLRQSGTIDAYIRSEGEHSLVALLAGFDHPGINSASFNQIDNLDSLPIPDYTDYNLEEYANPHLPITGSRGCVRACTFCDIHAHWQYRYRSGHKIAEEMQTLHRRYGVTSFRFTDSLVNGSLRQFREFVADMAKYNKTLAEPIQWTGQFIIRTASKHDEELWKLIAESGAHTLYIGIETGSDSVREHMKKKFTNADIDHNLSMMARYGVRCMFLMIVGYPTETDQDFQHTLDMFTRYQHYAGTTITEVNIGSTLGILPNTPLWDQANTWNIELDRHENNWIAWDNPDLTLEKRLARRQQLSDHVLALGYGLARDGAQELVNLLERDSARLAQRAKLKRLIRLQQV